jgi:hypothetical protein
MRLEEVSVDPSVTICRMVDDDMNVRWRRDWICLFAYCVKLLSPEASISSS